MRFELPSAVLVAFAVCVVPACAERQTAPQTAPAGPTADELRAAMAGPAPYAPLRAAGTCGKAAPAVRGPLPWDLAAALIVYAPDRATAEAIARATPAPDDRVAAEILFQAAWCTRLLTRAHPGVPPAPPGPPPRDRDADIRAMLGRLHAWQSGDPTADPRPLEDPDAAADVLMVGHGVAMDVHHQSDDDTVRAFIRARCPLFEWDGVQAHVTQPTEHNRPSALAGHARGCRAPTPVTGIVRARGNAAAAWASVDPDRVPGGQAGVVAVRTMLLDREPDWMVTGDPPRIHRDPTLRWGRVDWQRVPDWIVTGGPFRPSWSAADGLLFQARLERACAGTLWEGWAVQRRWRHRDAQVQDLLPAALHLAHSNPEAARASGIRVRALAAAARAGIDVEEVAAELGVVGSGEVWGALSAGLILAESGWGRDPERAAAHLRTTVDTLPAHAICARAHARARLAELTEPAPLEDRVVRGRWGRDVRRMRATVVLQSAADPQVRHTAALTPDGDGRFRLVLPPGAWLPLQVLVGEDARHAGAVEPDQTFILTATVLPTTGDVACHGTRTVPVGLTPDGGLAAWEVTGRSEDRAVVQCFDADGTLLGDPHPMQPTDEPGTHRATVADLPVAAVHARVLTLDTEGRVRSASRRICIRPH